MGKMDAEDDLSVGKHEYIAAASIAITTCGSTDISISGAQVGGKCIII